MPTVNKRIKEVRGSSGLTQDEFALKLGVKPSKIRDIEAGRQRVNDEFIAQLTANFTIDLNWLFSNSTQTISEMETDIVEGLIEKNNPMSGIQQLIDDQLDTESELLDGAKKVSREYLDELDGKAADFALIPLHEVEIAAGSGAENGGEAIIDNVAFRIDWLKKMNVTESNARLARVRGDSMFPTLQDHDLVLIDTTKIMIPVRTDKKTLQSRADIYALVESGLARVKRIEHPSEGILVLHSDNQAAYPPEIRTGSEIEALRIIGKVIWWGHTEGGQS